MLCNGKPFQLKTLQQIYDKKKKIIPEIVLY